MSDPLDGWSLARNWPKEVDGHPGSTIPFSPCDGCGRGTWTRYGPRVLCRYCARGEPRPPEQKPPLGATVAFTEAEEERFRALAEARCAHDLRHGIRTQKVDRTRSDVEIHAGAIGVHYAWCRVLGAPFSVSTTSPTVRYLAAPPGQSYTLQSRASFHALGHVIFLPGETIDGDRIGFGVPLSVGPGAHLVGWISREGYLERATLRDFGIGPQPALSQAALWEPERLPGWLGPKAKPPPS